jgi:hypothetical protein
MRDKTSAKWSKVRKARMWRTICLAGVMGTSFGWMWELLIH